MASPKPDPVDCVLCGEEMVPWMAVPGDWRRPEARGPYRLCSCPVCRFGQVQPRPDSREVADFYRVDSYYTHGEGAGAPAPARPGLIDRLRIKAAWLVDYGCKIGDDWLRARLDPGAKVCDLGCGDGKLLSRMARLGYEAIGVEPDPDARAEAERKGLRVLPGTAEDLPAEVRGRKYDCVMMIHVLEHSLRPRLAASNAARLLSDGGLLVVEVPNNEARGLGRAGVLWPWLDVPRHLNFFTKASLEKTCRGAGLDVLGTEYRGYARQFKPEWIDTERDIRAGFAVRTGHEEGLPSPRRTLNSWRLLLSTACSSPRSKYDSIRVVAGRPPGSPARG